MSNPLIKAIVVKWPGHTHIFESTSDDPKTIDAEVNSGYQEFLASGDHQCADGTEVQVDYQVDFLSRLELVKS